jgi:NADPH:quinone reductase-like Zn-dependent oxidoreductase
LLQAISINPVDYKILKGAFPNKAGPGETGWGSDVAGIVAAVGAEVTTLKVGDEVYSDAILHSPFATAVRIPAHKASKKPANLSFAEAATVPLAGQTALQALRDHGRMQPGFRVCVFGGSGGVGAFALQIAKALGASHVACTSSNKEMCERLGADQVVNYREADVGEVLAGGDFDIVFDTVRACERSEHKEDARLQRKRAA